MNTINISAEVLRELGGIADNENYMAKVLEFIKGLTQHTQTALVRGAVYTSLLEQLSDFQEYGQGWDGASALPLNRTVVKNFKAILQRGKDNELSGWSISPETNGTLLLQNRKHDAGINLGMKEFSYFIITGENVEGKDAVKFSPKAVISVIKSINAHDKK